MNGFFVAGMGVLVYALIAVFAYGLFSQCAKRAHRMMALLWPATIPILVIVMGIVWYNATVALIMTNVRGWGERVGSKVNRWIVRRRITYAPLVQGDSSD